MNDNRLHLTVIQPIQSVADAELALTSPGSWVKYSHGGAAWRERSGPMPGTWAFTAMIMAEGDDSGFDWDRWKDEMKESEY